MSDRWRFSLLGPVRAWWGDQEVDLGSRQQRAVLAILLLRSGVTVSIEQLIDGLWDERPPISAAQTVRTYVYRLRRLLNRPEGSQLIHTVGGGYLLDVEPGALDLSVVRQYLWQAERPEEDADPRSVRDRLRAALELWEDEALVGLPGEYARVQRTGLARLRLDLLEQVLNLEVQLGASGAVIGEIGLAVTAYPLDERFRRLLMLALYRTGQQAQALAVYRETQALLADELGVDPGPLLQDLYLQILRAESGGAVEEPTPPTAEPDPEPADHPSGAVAVRFAVRSNQLPPDPATFTGRAAPLAQLDATLGPASRSATGVVCLHGMAGAGKTALALHWAHRVADRFPDALVYLNLRGFDPVHPAVRPDQALPLLLETLGVQKVPSSSEAQVALCRNLLTGRRMLILLDNVRDAAQIRLLLPGLSEVFVIITSRVQLTSLIAREQAKALLVEVLSDDEAAAMFRGRLGPDRSDLAPEAVAEIVACCGGLPLALSLVAARATLSPGMPLPGGPGTQALDVLSDPDPTIDVRAVFSSSYRYLGSEAARLFRLMSLHPGPTLGVNTAVRLADRPARTVRAALRELVVAHVVEQVEADRFALHDLLRAYAAELCAAEDGRLAPTEAVHRMKLHHAPVADLFRQIGGDYQEAAVLEVDADPAATIWPAGLRLLDAEGSPKPQRGARPSPYHHTVLHPAG